MLRSVTFNECPPLDTNQARTNINPTPTDVLPSPATPPLVCHLSRTAAVRATNDLVVAKHPVHPFGHIYLWKICGLVYVLHVLRFLAETRLSHDMR